MSGKRFTEREVIEVIRRATELQTPLDSSLATIDEDQLIVIAQELGIDRATLNRALSERAYTRPTLLDRLFGGPLKSRIDASFDQEMTDRAWARFVLDCRLELSDTGDSSVNGDCFELKFGENRLDPLSVSVARGSGRTRLLVASDMSAMLIPFGALAALILVLSSIGILGTPLLLWTRLAAIAILWVLGWLAFRGIFGWIFRGRRGEVASLAALFEKSLETEETELTLIDRVAPERDELRLRS